MTSKNDLRIELRKKRLALCDEYRLQAEKSMTNYVLDQAFFQKATHIACYAASGSEMPTQYLLSKILELNKSCYLPYLHQDRLLFSGYEKNSILIENQFHILEPKSPIHFPIEQIEIFLMPLLGFDNKGNRLGQGKAFYDKSLASTKGIRVGLAFACQQVNTLPTDAWDLKLNAIITEKGCQYFE